MPTNPICPECKAAILQSQKFCADCGAQLIFSVPTHCPNGHPIKDNEKFCAECGLKISGKLSPSTSTGFMDPSAVNERPQLIRFLSQWAAAERKFLVDGDVSSYVKFWHFILQRHRTDGSSIAFLEIIENYAFATLLKYRENQEIWNGMVALMPDRILSAQKNSEQIKAIIKPGPIQEMFNDWPYDAFCISSQASENDLKEACLQTLRVGFWVLRVGTAARQQFLDDEKLRLESGLYPEFCMSSMRKLHSNLERALHNLREGYKKEGVVGLDAEAKAICTAFISPLSRREFADGLARAIQMKGYPVSFPYEPLSEWEKKQLGAWVSGEYKLKDVIEFLEGRWESGKQNLSKMTHSNALGGASFRGLEGYNAFFDMSFHVVTMTRNLLSQMRFKMEAFVKSQSHYQHVDYPFWPPSPLKPQLLHNAFEKQDPDLAKALFPKYKSLYDLGYLTAVNWVQHKKASTQ
ncbi:zinc ribbon domain-containing protein [Nitrospira sp. T9]|uniref:zinc ribbon domain-containing protein n=1 Tax=unclassified Nitrospira TaxID=2652172 RepID=UPI003F9B4581